MLHANRTQLALLHTRAGPLHRVQQPCLEGGSPITGLASGRRSFTPVERARMQ